MASAGLGNAMSAAGAVAAAMAAGIARVAGAAAGTAAGPTEGATVRVELSERERLLGALRECVRAVETVGQEPPPHTRRLSPDVAQERCALLASLEHAVRLVEAAPLMLAAASPCGEDATMPLKGTGGGEGGRIGGGESGARPKDRGDRRSKTPVPPAAGAGAAARGFDARTSRTKSTGDVTSSTGAGAAAGSGAPTKLRNARRREVVSPAPPAYTRPSMKITINGSYVGSSSSNRPSDNETEDERNSHADKSAAGSERSAFAYRERNFKNSYLSASESDLRRDSSVDSGTLTASSSESSGSSQNWSSKAPRRSKTNKTRDAKKSVSFYMDAHENRVTSASEKYQGSITNADKNKFARGNSAGVFAKTSRVDSAKPSRLRSARNNEYGSPIKSLQESFKDAIKTFRKGSASHRPGNAGYDKTEKPLSRGLKERPTDVVIKKKMGREKTMFELQRAVTTELLASGASSPYYMKRSVSNVQRPNTTKRDDRCSKELKPRSGNQQIPNNRIREGNISDKFTPFEMKRTSSTVGTSSPRLTKTTASSYNTKHWY